MSDDGLKDRRFFSSWSGGKDSCLALNRAVRAGGQPAALLTMMTGSGVRSRSHGLAPEIIAAQACSLDIPCRTFNADWDDYEAVFLEALGSIRKEGVNCGVFGDIDLQPHRQWVERVCSAREITPFLPLWQEERRLLLAEFIDQGFEAMIVAVSNERLDQSFLGRVIDNQAIVDLERAGVDACGEEGEFHTVVIDGPLFAEKIELRKESVQCHGGYSFLELSLRGWPGSVNSMRE